MRRARRWLSSLVCLLFCAPALEAREYDIIVYGGTSAGVMAAVQSARMGKSVALVSPDVHLGGLSSNGLGFTDIGNKAVIGGLAREFYHELWKHYQTPEAWSWQDRDQYGNRGQGAPAIDGKMRTVWVFEPHAAEQAFERFVAQHEIDVHRDCWLDRASGVSKQGDRIVSIRSLDGKVFAAKAFIDATYEGDLMAAAGVTFHVGREANDVYDEQHNGAQHGVFHHGHYFRKKVSPFITPGDPSSGLLPRVQPGPGQANGAGDRRIQAYCYRLCLTTREENRRPIAKPDGYDASQYELLARLLEVDPSVLLIKNSTIPNLKTDTNNNGPFSTDNIGYNYDYPEGTYEQRKSILKEHRTYQQGFLYFLANDPRVPEKVRSDFSTIGLARDEFVENGNWPYQIYVRESRRMIGPWVMTEADCLSKRTTPSSVGMGAYVMDSHNVQRYATREGFVQNEGDIGVRVPKPYRISYRSLVPQEKECTNLLVPVCLSSSHIAYGSIRMEPVFMALGQSAATAAALSIDAGIAVQDLPYSELKKVLQADGQVLQYPLPKNPPSTSTKKTGKNKQGQQAAS